MSVRTEHRTITLVTHPNSLAPHYPTFHEVIPTSNVIVCDREPTEACVEVHEI